MTSPEQMVRAVQTYVEAFDKADPEMVVGLFAPDATVEDPVGTPPHVGHDAIRAFYAASMQTGAKLHLEGPGGSLATPPPSPSMSASPSPACGST